MVEHRRSRRCGTLGRLKVEPGRYFSVPLFGGGYAYGYITFFNKALMVLCNIHDFIGDAPEVPNDVEEFPTILRDLRLGTTEFTLSAGQFSTYGPRWLLSLRVRSTLAYPENHLFLMGPRDARVVTDISDEYPDRPATPKDIASLPPLGFNFPPTTTKTVEIAVRRLGVEPRDFDLLNFADT